VILRSPRSHAGRFFGCFALGLLVVLLGRCSPAFVLRCAREELDDWRAARRRGGAL